MSCVMRQEPSISCVLLLKSHAVIQKMLRRLEFDVELHYEEKETISNLNRPRLHHFQTKKQHTKQFRVGAAIGSLIFQSLGIFSCTLLTHGQHGMDRVVSTLSIAVAHCPFCARLLYQYRARPTECCVHEATDNLSIDECVFTQPFAWRNF